MVVTIEEEYLTDELIAELTPLLKAHAKEICPYDDFEFNPDWATYRFFQDNDKMKAFVAREDGKVMGYLAYMLFHNLHFKDIQQAVQDVLYINPTHRGKMLGMKLIKYADGVMKFNGVHVVMQHVTKQNEFGPILERIGYHHEESVYDRRLN